MQSRTGNWIIGFGVLFGILGLCLMPAGLGSHGDRSLLGLGAALFGIGALSIAAGIYLKAITLREKNAPDAKEKATATPVKKGRGACDLCRNEMPVIHCKVHQFHLCGNCLAQHYDFRTCVYVPSTRRVEPKSGKNMVSRAHA